MKEKQRKSVKDMWKLLLYVHNASQESLHEVESMSKCLKLESVDGNFGEA